jgi:hypothetical protein
MSNNDSDEYIDLSKLDSQYVDSKYDMTEDDYNEILNTNGKTVYQLQPIENENYCYIYQVGKMIKLTDIIINEFQLDKILECFIISKLYTLEQLNSISNQCQFCILQITVNRKDRPICHIRFNFHTFDHKQSCKPISKYLSTNTNKIKCKGFYSITFHYNNKRINLESMKNYIGNVSSYLIL